MNAVSDIFRGGAIAVNKPAGITSHDVVAKLRRLYGTKKVGHTGTLDPMATGVLVVLVGRAVKASDMLTSERKRYVAEMKLGVTSDTEDITGKLEYTGAPIPCVDAVISAVKKFEGDIMQVPPMYSALKVGGKKLVDMARQGAWISREPRPVTVYSISANGGGDTYELFVECSKGTYIRTLCNDIGAKLNCGGIMESLVRIRSGAFNIKDAYRLKDIETLAKEGRLDEIVIPVDSMFEEYPLKTVNGEDLKRVENGNQLAIPYMGDRIRIYMGDGKFAAIYDYSGQNKCYTPYKMFLER